VLDAVNRCGLLLLAALLLPGCAERDEEATSAAAGKSTTTTTYGATIQSTATAPTTTEASRFLSQATFGPTEAEINALAASNIDAWLATQFALPRQTHYAYVLNLKSQGVDIDDFSNQYAIESFWHQAITGPDQLRQRTTWALSQIFVVGEQDNVRNSAYYDLLASHAFGNYRQLLEDVTLSPAMGQWLSHIGNQKEDLATGRLPDENYAREMMQLFSIGLWELNADGTRRLDGNSQPIPTYDQDDIRGMAKVLTGWSYANCNPAAEFWYCFESSREGYYRRYDDVVLKMQAYEDYHSKVAKTIVTKRVLPANRTAKQDLDDALDTLFNHPNAAPFIARQLIQRLVKSNPSPAYVGRVATAFANNGSGVRGDLKAVIRAVLVDAEARDITLAQASNAGKLREPIVRLAQFMRVFTLPPSNARYPLNPWWMEEVFGQRPLSSPSVFNFYSPNYLPPGEMAQNNAYGPEFQILHETSLVDSYNYMEYWVYYADEAPGSFTRSYGAYETLAGNPTALVDKLDLVLTSGTLSPLARSTIISAVTQVPSNDPGERFKMALMLFQGAPDYMIQK